MSSDSLEFGEEAEHTLRDTSKPTGVADYVVTTTSPDGSERDPPSVERDGAVAGSLRR